MRSASTLPAVGARAGEHEDEAGGVDAGAVEDDETGDASEPVPDAGDGADQLAEEVGPVTLEQRAGRVRAGEDRPRGARRGGGLDRRVEASRVDPPRPGQHQRRL